MKVKDFIEMLEKTRSPEDIVEIWEPDIEDWAPVSGCTFGGTDGKIHLYADID